MPLVVLRFSLREVDTNASHTEPAEGIKERIVCETGKKGSRKFFPSRYYHVAFSFRLSSHVSVAEWPARRTRNPSVSGLSPALATCWICSWFS